MKKIIIIGAGISGLSTGIHALKRGYDVHIYEKSNSFGGCCNGWVRDNIYIDNCMHWLTGTNQNTSTFKLWKNLKAINEASNLYQADYFYKSIYDNIEISLDKDLEKTRNSMLRISPSDYKAINNFIDITKDFANTNKNLFSYLKSYPKAFFKYKKMSLDDLSEEFTHPLLKKMLTDYIPGYFSSLALIYSYATFASGNGKIYAAGSKEFAKNIMSRFLNLNGKIFYNSEVLKINIKDNKATSITVKKDKEIFFEEIINTDYVICCNDLHNTFTKLLPSSYLPNELYKKLDNEIDYPLISSFHAAFKLNKKDNIIKDTVIIEIPEITIATTKINRLVIKDFTYLYPNKDETLIQAMIFQNKNDFDFWSKINKNKSEYKQYKEDLANKIKECITSFYNELEDKLELLDVWTPITYNEYYYLYNGSYLGFGLTKKSKLLPISNKIKGLENVYLASIWQSCIGGLPVAAKMGEKVIRKYF